MRTPALLGILSCLACKSDSKPAAAPPKQADAVKDQAHEIAKQPRTAMAGKTAFLEFTIDLPPSASMPITGEKETSLTFKDSKLELRVTESSALPSDGGAKFERGLFLSADEGTKTVTEEPGGYLVIDRRRTPSSVHAQGAALRLEYCGDLDPSEPPSGICCRMMSEDSDVLAAFGEQVCRSIKVKNRKIAPPSGSNTP